MTLTATAYGKNGTTADVAQDFTWTTSSASIADVVKGENGNTATVTGLKMCIRDRTCASSCRSRAAG